MIANLRPGRRVQFWYSAKRMVSAHHGKVGTVAIASRGPGPRNHGVLVDGVVIVVPCGNLREPR